MSIKIERAKSVRKSLTIAFVLQGVYGTIMIPRIPELIDQLGVNFTAWGAILGFSAVGALVGLMLANRLIVRFGSRRVLMASAAGTALMFMILPWVINPWLFFAIQCAIAFVGSTLNVTVNSQAVVLQKFMNRTIVPKFHAGWSIGAAASAGLSAYMASFMPMWLQFLVVPGVVGVALVLAASKVFTVDEIGTVVERKAAKKTSFLKSPWRLWLISAGLFAGVFPEAAIMDWSAVFGRKVLLLDAALSAVPYTFFVVAMIISRLSIAKLTRKFHIGIISFWAGIAGALAMGLGVFIGPIVGAENHFAGMVFTSALWFLAGLALGPVSPTFMAASGQIKGLTTAQGLARANLTNALLIMGAKVIMGAIAQNVDLTAAFVLPIILFFFAGIISGLTARDETKTKPFVDDAFPITGAISVVPAGNEKRDRA